MNLTISGTGCYKELLKMFAWIELLGNVGHAASFKVIADGDGVTRYKFNFEDKKLQERYDAMRKGLLENINMGIDIEFFEI